MTKILVLAKSGFGKTTSWTGREKYGIKGLNPKTTFAIQCIGRNVANLNFKKCPSCDPQDLTKGNRVVVDCIPHKKRFEVVANIINTLSHPQCPYKNIVVDDFNFLSQDYYMANAMKGGWDTPKEIGYGMGLIFNAFKNLPDDKNIFVCAHYEEYKDKNGDSISYRFKSTGKMVDDYITPEANFDIVLFGKASYIESEKKAIKTFVKEFDGEFPAKDAIGALDSLPDEFPNDLSLVEEALDKFRSQG